MGIGLPTTAPTLVGVWVVCHLGRALCGEFPAYQWQRMLNLVPEKHVYRQMHNCFR